jgi:hypothetical protein
MFKKEATLSFPTSGKAWKKMTAAAVGDSDEVIRRFIDNFYATQK